MEDNFPRGRRAFQAVGEDTQEQADSSSRHSKHKKSPSKQQQQHDNKSKNKRDASDFLFGSSNTPSSAKKEESSSGKKKSANKRRKGPDGSSLEETDLSNRNSMLPLGGGGVVVSHSKGSNSNSSERVIESLSFTTLHSGFQVLSIVREVHDDLAVFSLPNHWTGFMLRTNTDSSPACTALLQVGQILAVTIVKAVQEPAKHGGQPRRRIQVTCQPDKVNPQEQVLPDGTMVRGQVKTIEDHGLLVDLGYQRRGFLSFDDIEGKFHLKDDDDDDETMSNQDMEHFLCEGRILDFFVKSSSVKEQITHLSLPSHKTKATQIISPRNIPTLHHLRPGYLLQTTVEALAKNGLCVSFGQGAYRGAIESQYLGSFFVPEKREEATEWRDIFDKQNRSVKARIIAIDTTTKIIRLSMQEHVLNLRLPQKQPVVGALYRSATVLRCDPGIGALLALPKSSEEEEHDDDEKENEELKSYHYPPSKSDSYLKGRDIRVVYVHISKAMDDVDKDKSSESLFIKNFAPSTKHDVRILGTSNLLEGFSSGATAPSIVQAHVFSYADLETAKVYKQVSICANLEKSGAVMVDFGLGVRGLVPALHLFDQGSATSEYRSKMQKIKYAVGAKVDVRVLKTDVEDRKCILTAKKSLLNTKNILSSFSDIKSGQLGTGFVSKVSERGLYVTFFGGVFGFVPNRNLRQNALAGTYGVGDVIQCRVLSARKIESRSSKWDLTLAVATDDSDDMEIDYSQEGGDEIVEFNVGKIIPDNSLRIVDVKNSREKNGKIIPGFAIVEVKTKLLGVDAKKCRLPESIECKLPFDQLVDSYDSEDVESPAALDSFAKTQLSVDNLVKGKSVVLIDPKKTVSEHLSGAGRLAVLSLRPDFVKTARKANKDEQKDTSTLLPKPSDHLFVGAMLRGYVSFVDPRFGAFVRFLGDMSGLVPKLDGGLDMELFSTVKVRVRAIDSSVEPPKLLLTKKLKGKVSFPKRTSCGPVPAVGDTIEHVAVTKISPQQAWVRILDDEYAGNNAIKASIHCTVAPKDISKEEDRSDESHKDRPFSRWKQGLELSKLRVISVHQDLEKMSASIGLAPASCQEPFKKGGEYEIGKEIDGVVSSVTQKGIWVMINPFVTGFLPVLEVSNHAKTLNNISSKFKVGQRISSKVYATRTIENEGEEGQTLETPLLTLLDDKSASISIGDVVLGLVHHKRISRPDGALTLVLALRRNRQATCCITELAEPEDWVNFPLGNLRKHKTRPSSKKNEDAMDTDDEDSESPTEEEGIWGDFPPGSFVKCCILGKEGKFFEVSCRKSRINGNMEPDKMPEKSDVVPAFVTLTNEKGCFLRLSRQVEARVILKELSTGYVPEPKVSFPPGRLVVGFVKGLSESRKEKPGVTLVDLDLRESSMIEEEKKVSYENIKAGDKYMGTVSRIEKYGVFVRLDNSNVSGLVHKSECSENFIEDLASVYDPGDLVKVLVLRKIEDKKQLGLSMKASHFEDDEEDSDDASDSSDESESNGDLVRTLNAEEEEEKEEEDDDDSDSEASEKEIAMNERKEGNEDDSSEDDESSSSSDDAGDKSSAFDTNVGFDWSGGALLGANDGSKTKDEDEEEDESSSDDETDDENRLGGKSTRTSKQKHAARRKEELATAQRETALADGTADETPETSADFERLLASDPNSSELWIRYMAFHLTLADIVAARRVAEKALTRIEFREERDKMNVWCALLTLEVKYGSEDNVEDALARASRQVNPKHVHLRLCEIMEKEGSSTALDSADALYQKMCKKFRSKKTVWLAYAKFLLKNSRHGEAFSLSKRALLSLPNYKHIHTLSHFGQLLFENERAEEARAVFDALLRENPKRADLLSLYIDQEVKHGELGAVRMLCSRVADISHPDRLMKLSDKQMKKFFKRWFTLEENHGSEEDQDAVKNAAQQYVVSKSK